MNSNQANETCTEFSIRNLIWLIGFIIRFNSLPTNTDENNDNSFKCTCHEILVKHFSLNKRGESLTLSMTQLANNLLSDFVFNKLQRQKVEELIFSYLKLISKPTDTTVTIPTDRPLTYPLISELLGEILPAPKVLEELFLDRQIWGKFNLVIKLYGFNYSYEAENLEDDTSYDSEDGSILVALNNDEDVHLKIIKSKDGLFDSFTFVKFGIQLWDNPLRFTCSAEQILTKFNSIKPFLVYGDD